MKEDVPNGFEKSLFTSIFLTFLMLLLLSTFIIALNIPNPPLLITSTIYTLFLLVVTFMIFKTGKVSRYRSLFFVIYAMSFVISFISHLIEERGGMALTQKTIENLEVPLCPVAIPQLILPAVVKQTLIFPTKLFGGPYGGFLPIFFMWLVAVITLGRGWCSWGCFFGGLDEGFSKLLHKAKIPAKRINPKWHYFSFAVLILVVIWSFLVMSPVYCDWLCPLKLVTEYVEITDLTTYLQAIIFITLGMGLLFILPLLSKKRIHCATFCPLGALQSIVGLVNPYRVKIDKEKCLNCKKCERVCPVMAIKNGKVSITCTRCGKCMDECPTGAIDYCLLGIPFSAKSRVLSSKIQQKILVWPVRFFEEILDARTLFVFGALLFGAIISSSFVPESMLRIYHLFTKGTLLF